MNSPLKRLVSDNSSLLTVMVIAVAVRVAYLLAYSAIPEWDQLTVDNCYHHNWAISMLEGSALGGTTYFRAPFYVYCLTTLYGLFGVSLWAARIFGLIVGLASVFMTIRIGTDLFDRRAGLLAGLIHALYPVCLYFELELLLDPLFALLLQLALYFALRWSDKHHTKQILLSGLFLGLAAITRPTALIYLPLGIFMIILMRDRARSMIRPMAAFAAAALLVITPITIRNISVAFDPVLISSQGGINLYIGNNDVADGISAVMPEPLGFNWRIQQITHIAESDQDRQLKPGEVSSYWTSHALSWMSDNPGTFVGLYFKKLYYNLSDREISNNRNLDIFFSKLSLLNYNPLSFGLIIALSAAGLILGWRKNRKVRILVLLIVAYVVVASLFFFNSRFRFPLLPFYFVLAAGGLTLLISIWGETRRKAYIALTTAVVVGILSWLPLVSLPEGGFAQAKSSEGLYHYSQQNFPRARDTFRAALQADSTFPEVNLNLGVTFLKLGVGDSALYYFAREKQAHPARVKANINTASLHLLNGRYKEAVNEVSTALATRPFDAVANKILLRALFADTTVSTEQYYHAVIEAADRTGNDVYLLNDAAGMLLQRDAPVQAEKVFLRAANSQPPPIETDDEAFERTFRNRPAVWDIQRARSFYQLGFINGLRGRFDRAIEFSHRAIETDSTLTEAYINLVSGYMSTGQTEQARAIYEIARKKFPGHQLVIKLGTLLNQ